MTENTEEIIKKVEDVHNQFYGIPSDMELFKHMITLAYQLKDSKELPTYHRKFCENTYYVFKEWCKKEK